MQARYVELVDVASGEAQQGRKQRHRRRHGDEHGEGRAHGEPVDDPERLLAFYVAFVTVEGYIIVPMVMGRSMDLNATTVLLTTVYWHLVWGTAGLFLSMPLMAIIKAVCAHVRGLEPWARLMETEGEAKDGR